MGAHTSRGGPSSTGRTQTGVAAMSVTDPRQADKRAVGNGNRCESTGRRLGAAGFWVTLGVLTILVGGILFSGCAATGGAAGAALGYGLTGNARGAALGAGAGILAGSLYDVGAIRPAPPYYYSSPGPYGPAPGRWVYMPGYWDPYGRWVPGYRYWAPY